ncbi:Na+/H+ antiporter subunit E [Ornithinimicrobium sp. LYQ103]|uniref:Na+/H+ antiporter subunit E n=1 Tax=Ornithinimicrobium sp. LYQ103 TaxID=3378796 RepID=UPI003853ED4F
MTTWARRRGMAPLSVAWLTLVWMILWGNLGLMTLVSGLVVAVVVLVVFPLPRVRVALVVRPLATLLLVGRFLADVVVASTQVAWLTVRPGIPPGGIVMDLELAGDDELLQTITAEMVGLVPGTVVIDLDPGDRLLTLHALDVTSRRQAQVVRQRVLAQEARVLRAFHPDPASLLDPRRRREAERLADDAHPPPDQEEHR